MFCDSNSNTLTTAAITASLAAVRVQRPTNVYVRVRMYDRVEISRCLCRCFTRFGSSDCYSSFQPTVSQSMPSQLPSLLLLLYYCDLCLRYRGYLWWHGIRLAVYSCARGVCLLSVAAATSCLLHAVERRTFQTIRVYACELLSRRTNMYCLCCTSART